MSRRAASAPATLPPGLRVNDLLFLDEYLKPEVQLDGTLAYRRLHPGVKYETAASQACRLLKKPQVQAELARRMAASGISKQWGETRLREYEAMAYANSDYVAGASICMDAMKLAGFLVEKRADVSERPTVDRAALVEELRARGLVPSN